MPVFYVNLCPEGRRGKLLLKMASLFFASTCRAVAVIISRPGSDGSRLSATRSH